MKTTAGLSALSALLALAALPSTMAVVNEWGQCGGINYTGDTVCVTGTVCTKLNDYYFQCLKGTTTPSSTVRPSSTSSVRPSSASSVRPSSASSVRPSSASSVRPSSTSSSARPSGTPVAGNPFEGAEYYVSPYYADEVRLAVADIQAKGDAALAAKAAKVADIPTFIWFDTIAKVSTLEPYLIDAAAKQQSTGKTQIVPIVVYNLPERDCHAKASNGELTVANGGVTRYRTEYIDVIAATIAKYPQLRVIAVIEPDSLANLVTNLSDPRCQNAQPIYKESTIYAIQKLSAVNVIQYLDAGHAGWLGWPANLAPAAQLYAEIIRGAGAGHKVRGLATNVSNYNALRASSPDPATSPNPNYDEIHYIEAFAPLLTQNNFPAHFIVDQGRSGVQNIRDQWGNWCNIEGAGFGIRPTTSTGSSLIDAIVWIKPGGESDGTSNTAAVRYDSTCGLPDAHKPAPEAGTWFQAYFEALVRNANPPL